MNIEIKDFTKLDEEKRTEAIHRHLVDIADALKYIPSPLDKNIVLPFPVTKEMRIPVGYAICDKNNPPDLSGSFTSAIVYIRRL